METISTKQLVEAVGLTVSQFHNLKNRFKFEPLNPGGRILLWDKAMIEWLAELARNLRTYKGKRPENSVGAGWKKKAI